jgi:alpha-methylacyl-CoA racemase
LDGLSDLLSRGKRSISVNLKSKEAVEAVLEMIKKADVFIEPFRPGVAEKLGLGPDVALKLNPRLIYARMTGFGQDGMYSFNILLEILSQL